MVAMDLFLGFGRVGTFGFGGGQAMIPLMEQECVQHASWLSSEEFIEVIAMGNALPGPIAVKMAAMVGWKVGGPLGCLAAVVGVSAPAIVLMLLLVSVYTRFQDRPAMIGAMKAVRPVVIGLLAWTVVVLFPSGVTSLGSGFIAIAAFTALILGLHPAFVVLLAVAGGALALGA
jgi:chromate transporter